MVILEEDLLKKHLVCTWYIFDLEELLCAEHLWLGAWHLLTILYLLYDETNVGSSNALTLQMWKLKARKNKYPV